MVMLNVVKRRTAEHQCNTLPLQRYSGYSAVCSIDMSAKIKDQRLELLANTLVLNSAAFHAAGQGCHLQGRCDGCKS